MYFDSHAHYDDKRFNKDRDKILSSLKNEGIDYVVNVGADIESSKKSIEYAEKYDFVYATVGVHPHDVGELEVEDVEKLYGLSQEEKVVAIGEIGLDYHYENSPRDIQKEWFYEQIELAKEVDLPIVVHSREASQDTYAILKETNAKIVGGVIHCFSGSLEMAKDYVKDGFYIGVGGVVTFNNAKKLVEVVKEIPLESIVIETDCPYLSPIPNRGERNDSTNLKYIVEKIAKIKGISKEEVAETTKKNAMKLYRITGE